MKREYKTILGLLITIIFGSVISSAQIKLQTESKESKKTIIQSDTSNQSRKDFIKVSQDLINLNFLFSGGAGGVPVYFDSVSAKAFGYDQRSIAVAEDLAGLTNEILSVAKTKVISGDQFLIEDLNVSINKHSNLAEYLKSGEEFAESKEDLTKIIEQSIINPITSTPEWICGSFIRELPSSGAPRVNISTSNPRQYLISRGYHEPPSWYQEIGWTKDKTYYPSQCGYDTFRDNASITGSRTLWKQEYSGSPNGEPNPEVWRQWYWPYPYWPAYVYYWHRRH